MRIYSLHSRALPGSLHGDVDGDEMPRRLALKIPHGTLSHAEVPIAALDAVVAAMRQAPAVACKADCAKEAGPSPATHYIFTVLKAR